MVFWMSSTCVRHSQHASRCRSMRVAARGGSSPSQKRSNWASSGCSVRALVMGSLSQAMNRAPKELSHGRIADPQDACDLVISESFGAQIQALPLLGGQRFHRAMQTERLLAVHCTLLRVFLRVR